MDRRHRLLFVTSRFPFGAKELFLRDEINQLGGYHSVLISAALPNRTPVCEPWLEPITLKPLDMFSWRTLALASRSLFRSPRAALRAAVTVIAEPRSRRAKLKNAAILLKAFAVAEQARLQRIDHVHAYWLSAPATIAYVVSVLNRIPWSATGHRYDLVDYNIRSVGVPHSGFIKSAAFIRAISQRGREQIDVALDSERTKKFAVLEHLGVRISANLAATPDSIVLRLLCVAGLERIKGHDVLLDALARAIAAGARICATFAGAGSLRDSLEARAAALGITEHVTFRGVVPRPQLMEELAQGWYDAAILTSRDEGPDFCEGIPVSLIEAMAAGLPVIATRSGAVGELVDDTTGILCEPEDSAAIANAIVRLAADRTLRRRLGTHGRARVESEFDIVETSRRMAKRIFPGSCDRLGPTALAAPGARAREGLRPGALWNTAVRHYNRDDAGIT